MHSSASRAKDGTSSVKRACEDPNLRCMSAARNEPKASAVNAGTVIMPDCGHEGAQSGARTLLVTHAIEGSLADVGLRSEFQARIAQLTMLASGPTRPRSSLHLRDCPCSRRRSRFRPGSSRDNRQAHLAQSEPEMARDRFGFLQRHGVHVPDD